MRCSVSLRDGPTVIALAWHVDYWDHLGWRDRFASRAATARQRAYARQLGSGVFTPALVVDGAAVVVGSQTRIGRSGDRAPPTPLPVARGAQPHGRRRDGRDRAAPGPVHALRVVYDPEHATDVDAGENDGERLREDRVVREVETLGRMGGTARRFTVRPPGRRPGTGDPGAVGGPSYSRRGGPVARLRPDQGNAAIVALTRSGSSSTRRSRTRTPAGPRSRPRERIAHGWPAGAVASGLSV